MASKILIADDDKSIRNVVRRYLLANDFSVALAANGSDGLLLLRDSHPDILLVDAEMPGLDGFALCRAIKKDPATRKIPVIIMSGVRIEERDVLTGLEGGADDYMMKPLSLPILLARIQVVLRRYATSSEKEHLLKKCGIELDPAGRTVKVNGKAISLTRKEFDLLATLVERSGRVLSVIYLLETVWGYDPADYNDPGTVEVHISHLRKKLGPKIGRHIINVLGHGYKFET